MNSGFYSPDFAIEFREVTKNYRLPDGRSLEVLSGINLEVPRGCVYGLLGPNGAGKSTMIKMMSGLATLGEGEIFVWGLSVRDKPIETKFHLGVMEQEVNFDPFFTPYELMELQGGLRGLPRRERSTERILRDMHLWDERHYYSRQLSGGMKRRLMLGKAVVADPPVIVLDEPTAGVDVELRSQMWEWVETMKQRGKTILLTTHYLEEAEALCDHVAIINQGKKIADGRKQDLMQTLGVGFLDVVVRDEGSTLEHHLQNRLAGAVIVEDYRKAESETCDRWKGRVKIRVPRNDKSGKELHSVLNALEPFELEEVSFYEADLEEVFLHYVQEDRKRLYQKTDETLGISSATTD